MICFIIYDNIQKRFIKNPRVAVLRTPYQIQAFNFISKEDALMWIKRKINILDRQHFEIRTVKYEAEILEINTYNELTNG